MLEESKSMKELHQIREIMYEETKKMSPKEKVKYIHDKAEKAKLSWGLVSAMGSDTVNKVNEQ